MIYFALFRAQRVTGPIDPGATRFALAPGYYISRRWRWAPVQNQRLMHVQNQRLGSPFKNQRLMPSRISDWDTRSESAFGGETL